MFPREADIIYWGWKKSSGVESPPVYSVWEQYFRYMVKPQNLLDLGMIVPFYVLLSTSGTVSRSLGYLRAFRLLRLIRVMANLKELETMLGEFVITGDFSIEISFDVLVNIPCRCVQASLL